MSRAALPIVFRCGLPGNSRGWEGRVEVIRQGNNMAELIIAGRGSRMNAVIGKYLSGCKIKLIKSSSILQHNAEAVITLCIFPLIF